MSRRPIEVKVSAKDQKELRQLLRAGIQKVRVILRALALEQLSRGLTAPAVARIVHLTPQAVRRIGHRYQRGGHAGRSLGDVGWRLSPAALKPRPSGDPRACRTDCRPNLGHPAMRTAR